MPWQTVLDIVGPPGTIDVVDTITLAAGNNASASVSGTPAERKLTLRIPRGDKGDPGAPGANSVPTDTAIAGAFNSSSSQTRAAVDVLYSRRMDPVKYHAQDSNVLANGNFESGLLGWETTGTTALDTATEAFRGFNTVTMTGATSLVSLPIPVEADRTYRLEIIYRGGGSAGAAITGGIRIESSTDGSTWTIVGTSPGSTATSAWARTQVERIVPAGARYIRARIAYAAGVPAVRISEVALEDVTEKRRLAVVESTANAASSVTATNAAIAASKIDVMSNLGATDNYVSDPILRRSALGAAVDSPYWFSSAGDPAVWSIANSAGREGNLLRGTANGSAHRIRNSNRFPVRPGRRYVVVADIHHTTGVANAVQFGLVWRGANAAHVGGSLNTPAANQVGTAAAWGTYAFITTPVPASGVAFADFEIQLNAVATSGQVNLSSFSVYEATDGAIDILDNSIPGSKLAGTAVYDSLPERLKDHPNAVFIGDSNTADANHWPKAVCDTQGWTLRNFAVGGSAFIHATDSFLTQLQRARDSAAFTNASVGHVWIASPSNDIRAGHDFSAQVPPVFDLARSAFPNAEIHVLPALWPADPSAITGYSTKHWEDLRIAVELLRTNAGRVGAQFIDGSWNWLLGRTDLMITGEVHYNAAGHAEIARRVNLALESGFVESRTRWTLTEPMSSYYSIVGNSGWRPLSVQRTGDMVTIDGSMRASNSTSAGSDYARIPVGFRPAYTIQLTGMLAGGTDYFPITIYPNGVVRSERAISTGAHSVNVHGTFMID